MTRFLQTLQDQIFRPTGEDMLLLKEVKVKSFSVMVMYKSYDLSLACDFPHRLIWNSVVPSKMRIFYWEAAWGKILTLDNLKRRGMAFASIYFLCEEDEETIHHLLIHCKSAKMLWDLFLSMARISWVFPHVGPSYPLSLAMSRRGKEVEKNMDSSSLVSVLGSLAC